MRHNHRLSLLAMASGIPFLFANPGFAQEAQATAQNSSLEDIVVTAQKRSERLQDTPLAVSAVTAATIEQRGIADVGALSAIAPNLVISQTPASSTTPAIFIRGIGDAEPLLTVDSPNGLYVDGVVIGRSTGAMFDLVDLERIEVLRGPQGTLYGRNTTGGAINLITKKPADTFGVEQLFSYGRFDLMQSRTTVDTGELGTSGLRAKFSYVHKQRDGYVDNELASDKNDPGAYNVDAVRAAVSFDNGGAIRVNYAFDYNHRVSRSIPSQLAAVLPFMEGYLNASPLLGGEAPRISRSRLNRLRLDHDGRITDKVEGHNLVIEADLNDQTTLRSITGYRRWTNNIRDTDLDGNANLVGFTVSPAILAPPYDFIPEGINPISLYDGVNQRRQHQWSQEINLIGKVGERLEYVLGGFYFREKAREVDNSNLSIIIPTEFPIDLAPGISIPAFGVNIGTLLAYRHVSTSKALFGQASYELTDRLSVTGGLRYTWDKKELDQTDPVLRKESVSAERLTWMGTAKYEFNQNVSTYARVATGYKSGGFNARTGGPAFDSEKVTSYEIGLKSELFDRRVRLNLAGFHTRYRDLQVSQFEAGSTGANSVTVNAGKATYTGIEAELAARVTDSLTLTGNIGYVDRKFKEYLFRDPVTDQVIDVANMARFSYSSATTANAGVEYAFPSFGFGQLTARLDYNYRGKIYFHPLDIISPLNREIADGSASTFDGRLILSDIKVGATDLSLSLWGKNLTNRKYLLSGIDFGSLGFATVSYAEPRTWGLDLRARF